MDRAKKALNLFNSGYNCAQAVAGVFSKETGIDKENLFKLTCGFGGGCSRTGQICGALSGAITIIGLKNGNSKSDDKASKEITYSLVQKLTNEFKEKHNSVLCPILIGFDLGTEEGLKAALENEVHTKICGNLVTETVKMVEEIIKK